MSDGYGEHKMVLVVRQDLGMGKGKIAAQVGKSQQNQTAVEFLKRVIIYLLCGSSLIE